MRTKLTLSVIGGAVLLFAAFSTQPIAVAQSTGMETGVATGTATTGNQTAFFIVSGDPQLVREALTRALQGGGGVSSADANNAVQVLDFALANPTEEGGGVTEIEGPGGNETAIRICAQVSEGSKICSPHIPGTEWIPIDVIVGASS